VTFSGRLGIQHRDILAAIAVCAADVGIIFHHLARYFATNYPQLCTMVTVPGAEKFSSAIAMVSAVDPLRAGAATAFKEFFLAIARDKIHKRPRVLTATSRGQCNPGRFVDDKGGPIDLLKPA
jgi:hypothetical protein